MNCEIHLKIVHIKAMGGIIWSLGPPGIGEDFIILDVLSKEFVMNGKQMAPGMIMHVNRKSIMVGEAHVLIVRWVKALRDGYDALGLAL